MYYTLEKYKKMDESLFTQQTEDQRKEFIATSIIDLKDIISELEKANVMEPHWNMLGSFIRNTIKTFDPIITYIKNNR
jgi:hypothetical protein